MRVTIKRLRLWILVMAGLLMTVVIGFFFYGRNRYRHIERDLPGRLGINIQQTATGFSYSQSSQGHTLFMLKASKLVQLKAGHALLHDVDITLYGPPGSGRADRIYGSDFDYDQKDGIATSQGDVNIELQGTGTESAASPSNNAGNSGGSDADSNTIRIRTRGLTFVQKTGDAQTAQPVEFQLPRAAGSSVGADYNSKTGVLVLDSQVRITTSSNGESAVVQAGHATMLRASMQALLVNASIEYETESGSSDQATVYFRKDGTTERVDAQGHVRMRTDTGATVHSDTARILFDAKSQPTQTDLGGGVQFASQRPDETMHGSAQEGTLLFAATGAAGAQTTLRHAEFRQDVDFADEITGLPHDPRGRAEKLMQGEKVDVDFAPPKAGGQVEARKAVADGHPLVTMRQMPSKGPAETTRISGDHLVATLGAANTLQQLDGTGNTRIVDESTDGSKDTSQGDVLHATFTQQQTPVQQPAPKTRGAAVQPVVEAVVQTGVESGKAVVPAGTGGGRKAKAAADGPKMQTTLDTAVQDGHVVLTETPAKKPGATTQPATLTGWARHAEYHAADQVLHLTGSPRITDSETMQMSAELINYHRGTQNADATGDVKATYTQQQQGDNRSAPPSMGGSGPVHVIAQRAEMNHASGQNFFYGTVAAPARMWQDADSLLAPVIEIDRTKNVLKASGESTAGQPVVNANFTSAMGGKHEQGVVRVHSQTLVYSDQARQADFRGTVTAAQGNEVIHADDALLFLKPAEGAGKKAGAAGAGTASGGGAKQASAAGRAAGPGQGGPGQLDHMIATGHVVVTQPGRRGNGEKLVYTADDGRYILTGTAAAPPTMWDRVHGTTTGAALIFNSQDDSVVVSGGKSSAVTETRAPK